MKTLAFRIYLTVVAVLLLFTVGTGWLAQRHMEHERQEAQSQAAWSERAAAWGELIENSLPSASQPEAEQAEALLAWSERLRIPMALDNAEGRRIATSDLMQQRLQHRGPVLLRLQQTRLSDGRVLWVLRPGMGRSPPGNAGEGGPPPRLEGPGMRAAQDGPPPHHHGWFGFLNSPLPMPWIAGGAPGLVASLLILFVAVAIGAWPVAGRLTRRLKALQRGVETFGAGELQHRVEVEGRDEVAALAQSFNQAAQRIEDLVTAHRSLLANASHELRSPLARLKMAASMMGEVPPERAESLRREIDQDIRELDALVEEVLLASRLDAKPELDRQPVDVLGLVTEEARRVDGVVVGDPVSAPVVADERLLRRAVRNLLENARRYGGTAEPVSVSLALAGGQLQIRVCDRGPGVPEALRERIFEPFYRLPGHAEHAGGVGLGLSLVKQIAQRHGGTVQCEAREGGGSCFVLSIPL